MTLFKYECIVRSLTRVVCGYIQECATIVLVSMHVWLLWLQTYLSPLFSGLLSTPLTEDRVEWAGGQVLLHCSSVDMLPASHVGTGKNCKLALLQMVLYNSRDVSLEIPSHGAMEVITSWLLDYQWTPQL